MHPLQRLLPLICFLPLLSYAQLGIPDSAQVILYFPHFADGGTTDQQWQTKFTFINPNPYPVSMLLNLYGNDGSSLNIDFGSGPTSSLSFTVPSNGTRIYRSIVASPTLTTGWAIAAATGPVQATVAFRELLNGVAKVEITAEATLPSPRYSSAANSLLGIAVANGYSVPISVTLRAIDSEGSTLGQQLVNLPANGHVSFNLFQKFPNLPANFQGSIVLSVPSPNVFLAWTVNADPSGTISSLPPGRAAAPVSQLDRIWMVYWKLINTYQQFSTTGQAFLSAPVQLQISPEARINALASNGSTVQIDYALAELISDSPSELAFIMAHEMGISISSGLGN